MFLKRFACLSILFIFDVCNAADADCDYWQKIQLGNTYSITNPNYPNKYYGSKFCRWHAVSDTRVRIICNEFDIFPSPNCEEDSFNIFSDFQTSPRRYCGSGNFSMESNSKEMIVTLTTSKNTQGGRFHCYFEAIEEKECSCGWKKPTKIVGGKETGINEYPMMVGIINRNINRVYCGGTIIARRYVLTAAHCLNDLTAKNIAIVVGEHNLVTSSETNATKVYKVMRTTLHPLYVKNKNDYDIAIITIYGTLNYTNEIGPVCLPFQHNQDSFGGSFVDVLGWGTMEFAGETSNTLQKVKLSVTTNLICKKFYPDLQYRQICTFAEGKDACQFDSGGPVLWQNPTTKRLVLVGIISYGSFCASSQPGVNTRVGSFIDWIVQVTPGAQYCQAE